MAEGLSIAIVGATGAVGQDLVEALPESGLPLREVRLISSRTNQVQDMEVAGKRTPIHAMVDDLSSSALLEGVDLVLFATPGAVSRQHIPQLADDGIACIDIGGALAGHVALAVPGADNEWMDAFAEARVVSSPSAPSVVLSQLLAPLVRMGATACRGTVMLSAGMAGREGINELSQQVISLFNGGEPPRSIFPSGLAFDLNGQVGKMHDDWTSIERRLTLETAAVVHLPPPNIAMTAVLAPLFAGVAFSLFIEMDTNAIEDVAHLLGEVDGLRLGDPVPGPRRVAGRPHIFVGRLRMDPLAQGIHLYATADNLRVGASGNALSIAHRLWEDGLL